MAKRGGNHPVPGHFKVQGGAVEDRDIASMNKQALVREAARLKHRAPKKKAATPKQKRPVAPPKVEVEVPASFARVHDREFEAMNERTAGTRVKSSNGDTQQPRYLSQTARGVIRRVARVALAPLALARAVVDRFRDHD
ncbi:MAG: hypothetical protein LC659_09415 [Myxococcales bacterium]|nr:hypothetical protein [Myxococcales bacterium]